MKTTIRAAEIIAATNKKDQKIAREYCTGVFRGYPSGYMPTTYADIYAAYKTPSVNKRRAWAACKSLCAALDGYDIRITGRSAMFFSVAFRFTEPETGRACCAYITAKNERFAYMDDAAPAAAAAGAAAAAL